jgi:hypothetical protein
VFAAATQSKSQVRAY